MAQELKILPDYLKPPVPATNEAGYGFALDTATSPASLVAAQAHLGKLKASGNQRNHRVPIVGGTRHWNGAAGKLLIHNRKHNQALLKFDVVQ